MEGLWKTTKRDPAWLTSLRSRFEPEVLRMRKSCDARSKYIRQYAVVMQRLKLRTAHITTVQTSLNTETFLSIGGVRTSVVFIKWRPYLHSAILSTLYRYLQDQNQNPYRRRIQTLNGPHLPRRHRFKITYLLTYSIEQSPSREANWFCS